MSGFFSFKYRLSFFDRLHYPDILHFIYWYFKRIPVCNDQICQFSFFDRSFFILLTVLISSVNSRAS